MADKSEERYAIACISRSRADRVVNWWRPESHGYTIYLGDAGRYAKGEAAKIVQAAMGDEMAVTESFAERLLTRSILWNQLEWAAANRKDTKDVIQFNKEKEPNDG